MGTLPESWLDAAPLQRALRNVQVATQHMMVGEATWELTGRLLLGVPTPGSQPGYLFEQGGRIAGQASGYADVYKRGAFAWENKAPGKNLDVALRQLLGYTMALDNPPFWGGVDRGIVIGDVMVFFFFCFCLVIRILSFFF